MCVRKTTMQKYLFLLFVMILPNISYGETLFVRETLITINENHNKISKFHIDNKKYPNALSEIKGVVKIDSWGQKMIYNQISQNSYDLYSIGKNGINEHGSNDDVVSFETLNRSYYPELGTTTLQAWLQLVFIIFLCVVGYLIIKLKRSNKLSNSDGVNADS